MDDQQLTSGPTPLEEVLRLLDFERVATVRDGELEYKAGARDAAGTGGAVYVFVNADGRAWKVGMTKKGYARINYTKVFDGRAMKRPHEQRKLESIRSEVHDGATQWVLQTDQPGTVETLLICLLDPTESGRQRSEQEKALREYRDAHRPC